MSRGTALSEALLAILLVAAIVLALWLWWHPRESSSGMVMTSSGPTVTQLEKIGDLVALKVYIADVLTAEGEGYKGSWLVKGDALLGVDLRQAKVIEKDEEKRKAKLLLPALKVIQPRVDHTRTKTWEVAKTNYIFPGDPDKLRDSAMLQAQELVTSAAHMEDAMAKGRENASFILQKLYGFFDWEVEIIWADQVPAKPPASKVGREPAPSTAE